MLSLLLAVFVFWLGAKAFTKDGIPLTRQKNLHGTAAVVCGVLCFLLGAVLVLDGLFSIAILTGRLSR